MKQSPKEFMKMRRPERFSDTIITKKGNLNRSILEYKLGVITSNNQEQEFQNFCFKLAQLEIAPNLRPQTGPSGGGDSKADSETYPVSDFTSLNFWEGIANDSGERWAFAISAKKEWISKVKKDAKGIVDTGRDYKRIFFITNQFTRDKKRAEIEDGLSKDLSVRVTILDCTWILDRVFQNNRHKLAIEELNLGEGLEDVVIVGPNDVERMKLFEKLNNEIEEALSNAITTIKITDKALNTALLARGMGKSRTEVDGLFDRAIRLAEQLSSAEQLYSVKYEKAWTTFFWFEDFEKFIQLYDELESIAETSVNIHTLQRQNNLSGLLRALQQEKQFSKEYIQKKLDNIKKWLTVFTNDDTKPSASHQAKMLLALGELFDNAAQKKDLNSNFKEIGTILQGTERLIGFPYEESVGIIQENGDVFGDIPEYEKLINLIAEIDARRKGEIPAAKSFLKYGLQHLETERYYKAIEYIGRSLIGLYKKESKDDFIHALYFIAYAYEAVGLLWAARGSLIHAASYATSDLRQHQEVNELQSKCCRRLKMIELKLGRVGYILEWHEADLVLSQQLAITQEQQETIYKESLGNFSGILGCLLLKTRPSDLPKLEKAPDLFNRLAIDFSGLALLYLLGGEKYLPDDYWQHIGNQSVTEFFNRWLNQPAQNDLPVHPDYYLDETISLESNILGTHFIFESKNSSPGTEICEMIVAALEAYLSTAITMEIYGKVSEFKVVVEENPELSNDIQLADQPVNGRNIKVFYKQFNPHLLSVEVQTEISKAVTEIVIRIIAETIAFSDTEKNLKELVVDQRVDQRSFNFLSPLVMLGNVLGHNPRRSIDQWISGNDNRYPFDGVTSRLEPLSSAASHQESTAEEENGRNENDFFDVKGHQHIKTLSVINEHLWEGPVWRGFAFAVDPNPHTIQSPTLYLMFDNRQTAIDIFKEWKERFGDKAGEKIKICILKGIDAGNPYWYKGLISSNIKKEEMKNRNRIISMTKISTMTPINPRNLEGFLESYSRFGYFKLAPFFIDIKTGKPEPLDEWGFLMKELSVRNAWEVGVNDMEMTAIVATDNPVIPKEITNAPVLEVLKIKRTREVNPI
jgi:tetratricopeptide (TPR) repeat protein